MFIFLSNGPLSFLIIFLTKVFKVSQENTASRFILHACLLTCTTVADKHQFPLEQVREGKFYFLSASSSYFVLDAYIKFPMNQAHNNQLHFTWTY